MTLRISLIIALVCGLFAFSFGQLPAAEKAASDRVLAKIRKIELYNQILPVLMTPAQLKVILPILEKHRAEAVKLEKLEHDELKKLETSLDPAIKAAEEKGELPSEVLMKRGVSLFHGFLILRKALVDDSVDQLMKAMKANLNDGQIKAAANAFNPAIFLSQMKLEELTDDKKLDYWIRIVLMDNAAYDILLDLSRKPS
ncbi:MAG: hypothetical protein WD716_12255 [Fimbriimonadaceae bacterium]